MRSNIQNLGASTSGVIPNDRLTLNQINHLQGISEFPRTSEYVSSRLNKTHHASNQVFRRLEDRGFVRRIQINGNTEWELTALGRRSLESYLHYGK